MVGLGSRVKCPRCCPGSVVTLHIPRAFLGPSFAPRLADVLWRSPGRSGSRGPHARHSVASRAAVSRFPSQGWWTTRTFRGSCVGTCVPVPSWHILSRARQVRSGSAENLPRPVRKDLRTIARDCCSLHSDLTNSKWFVFCSYTSLFRSACVLLAPSGGSKSAYVCGKVAPRTCDAQLLVAPETSCVTFLRAQTRVPSL